MSEITTRASPFHKGDVLIWDQPNTRRHAFLAKHEPWWGRDDVIGDRYGECWRYGCQPIKGFMRKPVSADFVTILRILGEHVDRAIEERDHAYSLQTQWFELLKAEEQRDAN